MIGALLQLTWLACFVCVAYALGTALSRQMRIGGESAALRVALALGLGIQAISFGILGVGLAGWLYRGVVLAGFAGVWLTSWHPFRVGLREDLRPLVRRERQARWSWEERGYLAALGLALAWAWLGTLLPEIYGDSLFYHLGDPKYFVTHHRIEPVPYASNSLFPYGVEMLFTWALLVDGVALAKGMNLVMLIIIALGLYGVARARWSRVASLRVASLGVITPALGTQAATTYVEMGLAAYLLLAVIAVTRWMDRLERRDERTAFPSLGLAGLFLGMVLSIKHLLAIMLVVAFMIGLVGELVRRRVSLGVVGRGVAVVSVLALAVSGIWYLRAWHYWGNPFYPFTLPGMEVPGTGQIFDLQIPPPFGRGLGAFLLLPWRMTMRPMAFVGNEVQWGPLLLALVPGACLAAPAFPWWGLVGLLLLASVGAWFFSLQVARYLLPLLPLVAWGYGPFLHQWERWPRWSRAAAIAVVGVGLAINLGTLGYFHRLGPALLIGRISPHAYLTRLERSYPAAQWVNAHLAPDAKVLLVGELRRFYFDRELILEQFYFRQTRYDRAARHPDQVVAKLKQEGVTHLVVRWIDEPATEQGLSTPLAIQTLLRDPQFVARHLDLLGELPYQTSPNQRGRYLVYAWR